ncbi:uncharacterized protein LOC118416481 [Branchiostoma floridae]|uniref:Uncharacterized protein LOC118416481 n=1 Tax=Branchiostoma floridae TaxID=7739 RepID=A0A9J7L7H0_BRAFL|nr:uncharacterized protein LOC118416481 [Branchiostoma floridae]
MNDSHIGTTDIQGVVVLQALLNYNNTPGAQDLPSEDAFRTVPGLVDSANAIRDGGYRGDFVAVISREVDSPLAAAFNNKFDGAGNPQYKRRSMTLPFKEITDQTKQDPLWPLYDGLTDADIKALYEVVPDVKAIFLTDTVVYRGREKAWPSLTPNDTMTITDERLDFLKKTTDAVTRMVEDLTGHKETCGKDPVSEFPVQKELQLTGTLDMSAFTLQNVTMTVHTVQPHGVLNATLSGQDWSLYMIGIYDPLERVLHLYIPEPFEVEGAPGTLSCAVFGSFHPHDSVVIFTGRMRGHCSSTLSFFGRGGITNEGLLVLTSTSGKAAKVSSSSGPSLALPVVLSLLGGMVFAAILAAVGFFVYTKRLANSSASSLPMKENQ